MDCYLLCPYTMISSIAETRDYHKILCLHSASNTSILVEARKSRETHFKNLSRHMINYSKGEQTVNTRGVQRRNGSKWADRFGEGLNAFEQYVGI